MVNNQEKRSYVMSDEFLEWLDQCPNQWLRIEDSEGSVTYLFYKGDDDDL